MSETYMTLRGRAVHKPELHRSEGRPPMAVFRLAVNPRYFDRNREEWVEGQTEWYSVMAFGNLAENAAHSIHRGDPVVVYGRFRTSQWQPKDEKRPQLSLEIVATSLGHDLRFGTTLYARTRYDNEQRGESQAQGADQENQDHTDQQEPQDQQDPHSQQEVAKAESENEFAAAGV